LGQPWRFGRPCENEIRAVVGLDSHAKTDTRQEEEKMSKPSMRLNPTCPRWCHWPIDPETGEASWTLYQEMIHLDLARYDSDAVENGATTKWAAFVAAHQFKTAPRINKIHFLIGAHALDPAHSNPGFSRQYEVHPDTWANFTPEQQAQFELQSEAIPT
jgi:hypothetical protein